MNRIVDLKRVLRPSRYINNEINSIHKRATVRVALAFPDVYDVGMSHLGLRILYEVINDIPYASAERVFSPWPDMEAELRRSGLPLSSLETNTPLRDFDILGFSLQYELSYTTVLNMLDIAGIPLRSDERDDKGPIVIAGGPCTVNPMPMIPFIDAFLVGDGEEAIGEIIEVVYQTRSKGRNETLNALSGIEGLYVPLIHGGEARIRRRFIMDLENSPHPISPIVPYTPIVHDRITIEVSRGCSRGCRFCQAGMIYRPKRERSPEKIIEIAEKALSNTGYEEVSLSSLSTGDYCNLIPLLREMNWRFSERHVSISLPSLRVASVNRDVLKEIKAVRKTGFTIAPEAATERLRRIINKDFDDEDYERALNSLFSEGWENLKLYFMIGLPGERDEDIEAIPEMALKAIKVAKRYSRRFVNISVTVSPFVPKPHTPFQWTGQESIHRIKEKLEYLRERLSRKGINYKGHNPEMSLLEAVLSRADSNISPLILEAWKRGCRLDAWIEWFDFKRWVEAAEALGIDLYHYAERSLGVDETLPWDRIDPGIKKDFLKKEFFRSQTGGFTPDCDDKCSGCGLGCTNRPVQASEQQSSSTVKVLYGDRSGSSHIITSIVPTLRLRVMFSKTDMMRYLSHRELMTAISRALRRAEIPILYSQGFHPSPKMSFGPPLSVGVAGLKEYFDLEAKAGDWIRAFKELLNETLPKGIRITGHFVIPRNTPSLDSFIKRYEYEILCPDLTQVRQSLNTEAIIERETKEGNKKTIDLKDMVESLQRIERDTWRIILKDGKEKVRLKEVIMAFFGDSKDLTITRTGMYGWDAAKNEWVSPIGLQ